MIIGKRLKYILTKKEIERLREILEKEVKKPENSKYYATLIMLIQDLEKVSYAIYYLNLCWFIKNYKTKIDNKIMEKLGKAYNQRRVKDIQKYLGGLDRFYKYKKKDYKRYLMQSQNFFREWKTPMNFGYKHKYMNRVYLGAGFEFLLKAIYLKKGYLINAIDDKAIKKEGISISHPIKIGKLKNKYLKSETFKFQYFIDNLHKLIGKKIDWRDYEVWIKTGLSIVRIWRNEDLHRYTHSQSYDSLQDFLIKSSYYKLYKLFLSKEKPIILE